MAAVVLGARQVILTDREPLALECALETARASGIAAADCTAWQDDKDALVRPMEL